MKDGHDASDEQLLSRRRQLTQGLIDRPYDAVTYLERAVVHSELGYPDLTAGDAYRALLLTDEVSNEGFEYHEQAVEAMRPHVAAPAPHVLMDGNLVAEWSWDPSMGDGASECQRLAVLASVRAYQMLSASLLLCGCMKSCASFCERGLQVAPNNQPLLDTRARLQKAARRRLQRDDFDMNDLPDQGQARREVYPWNDHEPDRFSDESLDAINADLKRMAPKCQVQVASLPVLADGAAENVGPDAGPEAVPMCKQLGLFAVEDIEPGEAVLREYSLLTANNRHKDALCDACSCALPGLGDAEQAVSCDECYDTVFCSQECHDAAQERYHPAVCEKDVDAIAKDPEASESDSTLYLLLLARVLALAEHQDMHPLDTREVRFIWGDFVPSSSDSDDCIAGSADAEQEQPPPQWTLPFSFKYNIETPLHVLEKMDVDVFASLERFDLWTLNTLYAKFRGTASARKSTRDGRPDVAAVHPYWCLANHDCDPNVTWEWGGRMVLWAKGDRIAEGRAAGVRRGDEILNHYCDVDLPVQQRREWAQGSLGGWCMCQRCRDEASAADELPDDLGA